MRERVNGFTVSVVVGLCVSLLRCVVVSSLVGCILFGSLLLRSRVFVLFEYWYFLEDFACVVQV